MPTGNFTSPGALAQAVGFSPGGRRLASWRREALGFFFRPIPAMLRCASWPRPPPHPRSFFPWCFHFPVSPMPPDWTKKGTCSPCPLSSQHGLKFTLTSSYFSSRIELISTYFKNYRMNSPNRTFYSIHLTWIDFFPINH